MQLQNSTEQLWEKKPPQNRLKRSADDEAISNYPNWLRRRSRRETCRVIVVGTNTRGYALSWFLGAHPELGKKVIGFINTWPEQVGTGTDAPTPPVLGQLDDMSEVLCRHHVDEIFFAVPRKMIDAIEPAVQYCQQMGIPFVIAGDLFTNPIGRRTVDQLHTWPLIRYESNHHSKIALRVKRTLDFTSALLALLVLSPALIAIAMAIKLTSPGPIFFVQERCGLNRRPFKMIKFRTMCQGAEKLQAHLLDKNEMKGPTFKMSNDPRISTTGRWLRKYAFDELPQLFNVLKGDMSLVGPRPPLQSEVDKYVIWHYRRLSMRPGLTCFWQTSGGQRHLVPFEHWVKTDLDYVDRWSLWLDVKIIVKTIPELLRGNGL